MHLHACWNSKYWNFLIGHVHYVTCGTISTRKDNQLDSFLDHLSHCSFRVLSSCLSYGDCSHHYRIDPALDCFVLSHLGWVGQQGDVSRSIDYLSESLNCALWR